MNLGQLSVRQPIFAIVLSIVTIIIGGIAYLTLPVTEYPDVVPPTVVVSTSYPGASAQAVADTIATPIEQEVNGVEDMLYLYSQATSDGGLTLTVTFKPGTDLDKAQVLVQNRVALAVPRLPEPVQRNGVSVKKSSPTILSGVFLYSPDGSYDQLYVSNFALRRVVDVIKRIDGVGDIQLFGVREYSMRIWLDPERAASFNLTPADIRQAVNAQSTQVAGGVVAEPPVASQAFQSTLIFEGRLKKPAEFGNIIVKSGTGGRIVRLKDVARVEIGALTYTTDSYLGDKPAVALAVLQRPGANALSTQDAIAHTMAELKKDFPAGIDYDIGYNPTAFIGDSIHELVKTIYEAMVLVVLVVVVFLQGWRPSIIPILAIPVSLVGTMAVMAALGFSINNLSLFGLVLAVGIVVDDAIVVVENVERHLSEGKSAREATLLTMQEVGGALVAIALVLASVFVPTAFIPGLSGQFFRQFGITIAVATIISLFNSFTLSPALVSMMLKRHAANSEEHAPKRGIASLGARAADTFNAGFEGLSVLYGALVTRLVAHGKAMLGLYVILLGATGYLLVTTPKGYIPTQDRGYIIAIPQLPAGASLERTTEIAKEVGRIALDIPGVSHLPTFAGFSGATQTISSSSAAAYVVLEPFEERMKHGETAQSILEELRKRVAHITGASILVVPPPPVSGIGSAGGFSMRLEDRAGLGTAALAKATNDLVAAANATPGLVGVYTTFSANTPQTKVEIDRERAEMLGVASEDVNGAIESYFGSSYINDFNLYGRTYRVTAQADLPFRTTAEDLTRIKVRNAVGDMVPLGNVVTLSDGFGADRVPRYNLYPATEVNGDTLPGFGAAYGIATMEKLAKQVLPAGISFEWTDLSYQQTTTGNLGLLIFPLSVVFVYLVLAAQYGSWSLPFSILMIVPMVLLAGSAGVRALGQDINILTQIGFIVLVGLAAKNAILIVEVARQLEQEGHAVVEAVVKAARLRLRPILMTSFAFILGVLPLVTSSGPGAEMRQAMGIAVFFGMLGVTLFGLAFTPVFYVVVRRLSGGRKLDMHAAPSEAIRA
ncbi:multidrug efflux RND transporter permease subunit [Starkeya sp. ORNL1]|uniref:efflux RND transporter permease subunit n=1 Tax=Starkeya sp. ORNL1 TaxID=2709380 RepID=UPI001462E393|nr:multidrug efflux RND transporter permease subunit [Starkeya sp. ORNL1]QJP17342.1 multidrug efflux RND transporter permease subunit [Starkeya sp. ORNL1]